MSSLALRRRPAALLPVLVLLLSLLPGAARAAPHSTPVGSTSAFLFVAAPDAADASSTGRYQVLGSGSPLWVEDGELWITLFAPAAGEDAAPRSGVNLRLHFAGANPSPRAIPFGRQTAVVNSFIGSDAAEWRANAPTWAGVRYVGLYPGLDLVVSSSASHWNWRIECSAAACSAALRQVQLQVEGAQSVELEAAAAGASALRLHTAAGKTVVPLLGMPAAAPVRAPVVEGANVLMPFATPRALPPAAVPAAAAGEGIGLFYSTFLGGTGYDVGEAIAVDASGAVYVTGTTESMRFPTTSGAFDTTHNSREDAFVTKLASDGETLLWSTYLGGSSIDISNALAIDAEGAVYVAGYTYSDDFPVTEGAFSTTAGELTDVFVTKLAPDGAALGWSTYLGGVHNDQAYGLGVDATGAVYVTGFASSSDFPTTSSAFDTSHNGGEDVFVTKVAPDGATLVYSTFIGGERRDVAYALAMDEYNAVYVVGFTESGLFPLTEGAFDITLSNTYTAFVTKVAADGAGLVWSTYLGGSSGGDARGVAVGSDEAVYVVGYSWSDDFPVTEGALATTLNGSGDGVVTKLAPDGASLIWSTYLGGSGDYDLASGVAIDAAGIAYVAGRTDSTDFPTTSGAFDTTFNGGDNDGYLTKVAAGGAALEYSTFLGGYSDYDTVTAPAVDATGAVYMAGYTESPDFPTTASAFDPTFGGDFDVFVAKLDLTATATLQHFLPLVEK